MSLFCMWLLLLAFVGIVGAVPSVMSLSIQPTLDPAIISKLGLDDDRAKAQELSVCETCTRYRNVVYASTCTLRPPHHNDKQAYSQWCIMLHCNGCGKTWNVCRICNTRVKTSPAVHDKQHPVAASIRRPDAEDDDDDGTFIMDDDESLPQPPLLGSSASDSSPAAKRRHLLSSIATHPPSIHSSHFKDHNTLAFVRDHHEWDDVIPQLVYQSMSSIETVRDNDVVSDSEASFHLKFCKFVKGLSKLQQEELSFLIEKGFMADTTKWTRTCLPVNISDFNQLYLRSPTSLLKTMPYPRATVVDGHAVNSLIDVARYAMLTQQEMHLTPIHSDFANDVMGNIDCVEDSHAYRLLVRKSLLKLDGTDQIEAAFLALREWMDDFDPSSVKCNKGSIWISVVSFGAPEEDRNSTHHVYPIALGRKGDSHDSVMAKYSE